jgi:exosortase/archaeosortase family protein
VSRSEGKHTVRFVVLLLALCVAFAAAEALTDRAFARGAAYGLAVTSSALLGLERDGTFVGVGGRSIGIDLECTALPYGMLFLFALAVYPAPWRRRLVALAVGVPALFLFDLVRLAVLLHLHGSGSYSAVHALSGALYVGVFLAGWIAWTHWSGGPLKLDFRHPAVSLALLAVIVASLVDLAAAQGPPPPPPPPPGVPLGGAEFALAGLLGAYLFRLRRSGESRQR